MHTVTYRQKFFAALLVLLSCAVLAGSLYYGVWKKEQERAAQVPFAKVANAPSGVYRDIDGNSISLTSYSGAPLIVVAWASWCPQCAEQLASLARIKKETGSTIPVLAVNRKEYREMAVAYLDVVGREEGLTYILDTEDHYFKASEGYAMPELILYGDDGAERAHIRGSFTEEELRGLFASL